MEFVASIQLETYSDFVNFETVLKQTNINNNHFICVLFSTSALDVVRHFTVEVIVRESTGKRITRKHASNTNNS